MCMYVYRNPNVYILMAISYLYTLDSILLCFVFLVKLFGVGYQIIREMETIKAQGNCES